jgi:hypothetical protein
MSPPADPKKSIPMGSSQGGCNGLLASAINRSGESQLNLYFDKILHVQSQLIEKGSNYNNVVVTIIYAGSFLLIGSLSDTISQKDLQVVGLLLMLSLIGFACWTVGLSYQSSAWNRRLAALLADPTKSVQRKLAEMEVLERKQAASLVRHFSIWLWVFQFCLISGFGGAFLLLIIFGAKVIGIAISPMGWLDQLISW